MPYLLMPYKYSDLKTMVQFHFWMPRESAALKTTDNTDVASNNNILLHSKVRVF